MKLEKEIKTKEISNERIKAVLEILFTASYINHKHSLHLKPYNISPQQYNIMRILRGSHPSALSMSQVVERMLEKSPHSTRMMDKLCAHGYAERKRSEIDRRKVFVKISEHGLKIMKELDQIHPQFMQFTHNLTTEEANQLIGILEKLRD